MTLSVCFSLEADGGETIDVRTDRYCVNGGPGDEHNHYNGHRIEYTAKKGINLMSKLHHAEFFSYSL